MGELAERPQRRTISDQLREMEFEPEPNYWKWVELAVVLREMCKQLGIDMDRDIEEASQG
jgi:hypothetical protein